MMILLFKIALVFTIALFFFPKQFQYYFGLILHLVIICISVIWAVKALILSSKLTLPFIPFWGNTISLEIDQLSAFFILVIDLTMLTGIIYAKGYLQPYLHNKSKPEMARHFFNFLWLHISMILVVSLRDALPF